MKKIKYIVSLVLFCLLLILDILFALATVAVAIDKKESSAVVVGIVFSAFFIFLTVKCRSYSKKLDKVHEETSKVTKTDKHAELNRIDNLVDDDAAAGDEPLWVSDIDSVVKENAEMRNVRNLKPNYEIKYRDAEGNESLRKVFVRDFDGKVLDAYCFLRNEDRSFYVPRIVESVDLETGEVLSNYKGDLRWYFNERFKKKFKPSDMFEYREWNKMSFSSYTPFVDDINGFDVNDDFKMKIVTYKEGIVSGMFHCGKVYSSMYEDKSFYVVLDGDGGIRYNVEPNKIISVEGVEDFGKFINEKFLNSNEGKARRLQKECKDELSVFVYLGRADDASINEKKRSIISNYLKNTGRDCSNEILSVITKRIKVDTVEFKKIVNALSKSIDSSKKPLFLAVANEIVGGKEKAKPFGLAGLQYVESKIKV